MWICAVTGVEIEREDGTDALKAFASSATGLVALARALSRLCEAHTLLASEVLAVFAADPFLVGMVADVVPLLETDYAPTEADILRAVETLSGLVAAEAEA
jgi:hypothetical protein